MVRLEGIYIGIDLNNTWTQISYLSPGMKTPETVSMVMGEERYRIPTALCRQYASGSWQLQKAGAGELNVEEPEEGCFCIDGLWEKSLQGEIVRIPRACLAEELFWVFLRKVIRLVPGCTDFSEILGLTFHLQEPTPRAVQLLQKAAASFGIPKEQVFVQDDAECFCHFAMHQERELMQHDVALFACEEHEPVCYYLKKKSKTRPQKVEIERKELGVLPLDFKSRDNVFGQAVEELFRGNIVSSAYLTGAGLEGGWLQESIQILCRGRRVFQGKNLYATGACYGSYEQIHKKDSSYVYFSEYKLANNVYIQVRNGERQFFVDLAEAGSSCYEAKKSCQVLLEGDPSLDVWLQKPDSSQARIESLQLTDLPKRPPKATRLLVEALPSEKKQILIRVTDLGFEPWYAASGKVWEYCIDE